MDIFDQASELERINRESALLKAQQALHDEGPEWINGEPCCRECGEAIPPERIKAIPGVGLCLSCQEEREREQELP